MFDFLKKNNLKISLALSFLALIIVLLSQTGGVRLGSWGPGLFHTLAHPFQYAARTGVEKAREVWTHYVYLVGVQRENELLREKNNLLEYRNARLSEVAEENRRLKNFLSIEQTPELSRLLAQVVYEQQGKYSKVLILNKGSSDSVRQNQAVISYNGAVGKIIAVSEKLSQVQLLLDARSKTPALLQNSRVRGILQGSQDEALYLRFIPSDVETQVGEAVITSGLAGIYPKGLMLGKVEKITKNKHDFFQTIEIRPSTNFNKLEELFIILQSRLHEYTTLFSDEP